MTPDSKTVSAACRHIESVAANLEKIIGTHPQAHGFAAELRGAVGMLRPHVPRLSNKPTPAPAVGSNAVEDDEDSVPVIPSGGQK